MKSTLEFNLPEEKDDLMLALKGPELSIVIDKLLHYIRSEIKHKEDIEQSRQQTLEDVRQNLLDLMNEYGVEDAIWR